MANQDNDNILNAEDGEKEAPEDILGLHAEKVSGLEIPEIVEITVEESFEDTLEKIENTDVVSVPETELPAIPTQNTVENSVTLTKPELAIPAANYSTAQPSTVEANTLGSSAHDSNVDSYPTDAPPLESLNYKGPQVTLMAPADAFKTNKTSFQANKNTFMATILNGAGILFTIIPFLTSFAFIAGIGALVFAIIGIKKKEPLKWLAILNIVAGSIGLIIVGVLLLFFVVLFSLIEFA